MLALLKSLVVLSALFCGDLCVFFLIAGISITMSQAAFGLLGAGVFLAVFGGAGLWYLDLDT